jgi:predicted dehydrogenase/threonine dehydrogenase-like Zn-dependent dehydrogenase
MKQVLQNLRSGATTVADVPAPQPNPGELLIATRSSLMSAGTERMLVEFGRASLVDKARHQPARVREVIDKVRSDGLLSTIGAVRAKLDEPLALGYCNVGSVVARGAAVSGYELGDRVVSNSKHAEIVACPAIMCARVPLQVDDETASFTVLGAVALQGIRLLAPTLGETIVVTGLGIVGLLAAQILRASGCRVLGIDHNPARLALAREFCAETVDLSREQDPLAAARAFSQERGVDGVLLAASARSSEPLSQAARMCRKRGRIVLVGVTGMELSRADFYEKELSFQVSCSYGPGRYDPSYEHQGKDYPIGFVRWTAQRNFEAVLELMSDGRIITRPLVSHRFDIGDAAAAYDLLVSPQPSLGIVLQYPRRSEPRLSALERSVTITPAERAAAGRPRIAFIGAGNYGGRVLVEAFRRAGASLEAIASRTGVSAAHVGRKHAIHRATTDVDGLMSDPNIDALVISTRHDTHARLVIEGLGAGKHVFVEKPLCLTRTELEEIRRAYTAARGRERPLELMVGFNRRFAPLIIRIGTLLEDVPGPKTFAMTVNSGAVATDHWTQDPTIGGGRLLGEACHFVDLLRHLAGTPITSTAVTRLPSPAAGPLPDSVLATLNFADGSVGIIQYLTTGSKRFPKERLEVFCAGRVLQLDNFRRLTGFGWPGFSTARSWRQDKGQRGCAAAFVQAIAGERATPIAPDELFEVAESSIEIAERA